MAKKKSTTSGLPMWVTVTAALAGIAIAGYVVLRVIPPTAPAKDSCALLAEQRSATLDIEATVRDLDLVKAKLGVTGGQVQDVDAVLEDYAFKYASSCRDHEAGRMSEAEYACRRDNMDRALDSARALSLTLEQVKNIADPAAQRDVVLRDLETITRLATADFAAGCGSALVVAPDALSFEDHFPERTFELANGGNRDATYAISELPEAFVAVRSSGAVGAGKGVVVSIKRAPFPLPAEPVVFYVNDNFGNRVAVRIAVSSENARLYQDLGMATRMTLPPGRTEPTLEDALATVSARLPQIQDEGTKYFFASGILQQTGSFEEAGKALDVVSRTNKDLDAAPSTQLMHGIVNFKLNRVPLALQNFEKAGKSETVRDERAETNSKAFAGAVLLSEGRQDEARAYLSDPSVKTRIARDAALAGTIGATLQVQRFSEKAKDAVK